MEISGGGVGCIGNVREAATVIAADIAGIARVTAQRVNEQLVIVDAEGIDDVRERASLPLRGRHGFYLRDLETIVSRMQDAGYLERRMYHTYIWEGA